MAEYVAVPQQITLHVQGNSVKEQYIITKKSFIQVQRKCSQRSYKVAQFSSWKACKLGACCVTNLRVKVSSMKCYCLGDLISSDGPTISSWIPIVNQLLLMTSIFLTYAAGVIPLKSQKNLSNDHVFPEDPTFSGSAMKNNEDFNLKLAWDIVKQKLTDSLNAFGQRDNLENRNIEFEPDQTKRPSCLFALAEGPRLRLLWATFLWLKEEVDNIPKRSATVYMDDCLTGFSEIIKKFGQLVCLAWLEKELCLKNSKADKAVVSLMFEKLNRDDGVLQTIRKSGKENLYAELICFLRFGSLSIGCSYDYNLFMLHGVAILEDLVIALAECIAGMYLELISVDGNMSSEMNRLGLILCTLSTRALQRLRNEVMLNQWLHQNMEVVVSMYEDRFDLCTLKSQLIEEPSKRLTERLSWWKKLTLSKSRSTLSPLCYVVISYLSIPVKRTKELKALTGWRYYFSLFLELADISMPLFRTVFAKVSDAISFFLVCLIGRSLGLIYTGIRQSLRWK